MLPKFWMLSQKHTPVRFFSFAYNNAIMNEHLCFIMLLKYIVMSLTMKISLYMKCPKKCDMSYSLALCLLWDIWLYRVISEPFSLFYMSQTSKVGKISKNRKKGAISTKANSECSISISTGDSVTSDPETVANGFNDFFTTIADSIREKMPPSFNHFSSFLKNPNINSLVLTPTSPEEIAEVIGSFSKSKASGPNSIPVKILKLINQNISAPISTLINSSFASGIFPSVLKISKVVPVFKNKGSHLEVSNYRPISPFCLISRKYTRR